MKFELFVNCQEMNEDGCERTTVGRMGEMIEFREQRVDGGRLSGHSGEREWAGSDRDPGVVGPRRSHQGRVRPLRRGGLRGPGAGPLPRQEGAARRARRSGQGDDGDADGPGGARHERCRRRGVAAQHGRQGRRHRVLHGRRAGAGARDAAPGRRGGGRPVLRHHPVARRAAGLRGHVGGGAWATTPRRTASSRRRPRTRWRTQLRAMGKSVEIVIYPDTDHAFFNDTRPEVHDAEASRALWDRTLAFFTAHSPDPASATPAGERRLRRATSSAARRLRLRVEFAERARTERARLAWRRPSRARCPPVRARPGRAPRARLLPSGHVRTLT